MRVLFLVNHERIRKNSAFLLKKTARSAQETVVQEIYSHNKTFSPRSKHIDVIVDRSFAREQKWFDSLHQYTSTHNIPVTNPPLASKNACDKRSYLWLHPQSIPPTRIAGCVNEIAASISDYGVPVVVKDPTSSFGDGVERIYDAEQSQQVLQQLLQNPTSQVVVQPYMKGFSEGDKRVLVQKNKQGERKIMLWYKRVPQLSWKTNVSQGGTKELCKLLDDEIELSLRIAEESGLDTVGIDIGRENNKPYLIETNTYPGFLDENDVFSQATNTYVDNIKRVATNKNVVTHSNS